MINRGLIKVLLGAFLIRYILAFLPSFQVDMGAWLAWAYRLAELGPAHFYSDAVWTQYTPGYLYWLWIIGKLGIVSPLAIKIPVILVEIWTGYTIYKMIAKQKPRLAVFLMVLVVLNPVAIIDGSIWGQIDGLLAGVMFMSAYYLTHDENIYLSYVAAAIALLIKPQAMAIIPALFVLGIYRFNWRQVGIAIVIGFVITMVGYLPFYPGNPLQGAIELLSKMGVSYSYTSLFAFNLWGVMGMWIDDSTKFLQMTYFNWGSILLLLGYLTMFYKSRKYLKSSTKDYLIFAISCGLFFFFPTRVHERYLFPMFVFLIGDCANRYRKSSLVLITMMLCLYAINLYLPYSYYESPANPLKNIVIENMILNNAKILSFVQLAFFLLIAFYDELFPANKNTKELVPEGLRHRNAI